MSSGVTAKKPEPLTSTAHPVSKVPVLDALGTTSESGA